MNMDEFIDLCIMCGCDYTHSIGGIGPIKAFNLIKEHGNIEKVLE
jgi:flap endonuclease-1